jgi:hypothetical protein
MHYKIERGVVSSDRVVIRLASNGYFRAIDLLDAQGGFIWEIFTQAPSPTMAENSVGGTLTATAPILEFRKSNAVGVKVVAVLDLHDLDCLQAGDRVTFTWSAG